MVTADGAQSWRLPSAARMCIIAAPQTHACFSASRAGGAVRAAESVWTVNTNGVSSILVDPTLLNRSRIVQGKYRGRLSAVRTRLDSTDTAADETVEIQHLGRPDRPALHLLERDLIDRPRFRA